MVFRYDEYTKIFINHRYSLQLTTIPSHKLYLVDASGRRTNYVGRYSKLIQDNKDLFSNIISNHVNALNSAVNINHI